MYKVQRYSIRLAPGPALKSSMQKKWGNGALDILVVARGGRHEWWEIHDREVWGIIGFAGYLEMRTGYLRCNRFEYLGYSSAGG